MKVVVIGGVAAGMSAASKLKRSKPDTEIIVYERGTYLSYGACGLPYYVSDEIKELESLVIRTKAQFEKSGIQVFDQHEVLEVDPEEKTIVVKDLQTGYLTRDTYDKLVVASGASPILPSWEGIDLENVFALSTLEEGQALKKAAGKADFQKVLIVGAGFIGIEVAEAMALMGKEVRLIEFKDQILPHLDKEMADILESELRSKGVSVHTDEAVEKLLGQSAVEGVVTNKGSYDADLVVVSIGIRPNTGFFKDGRVEKLGNGAIKVNQKMESSHADIYAAGDCASVYHFLKDSNSEYIPLATNANKQGKLLGSVLAGEEVGFLGALGSSMIKVFDQEGAKTGLSEREAKDMGLAYQSKVIESSNKPHYYPGSQKVTVKLVVEKDTHKLLGGQMVGGEGTALRINTLAVAIHAGLTTEELGWIDFGYAPPFAPPWGPIQTACNVIK